MYHPIRLLHRLHLRPITFLSSLALFFCYLFFQRFQSSSSGRMSVRMRHLPVFASLGIILEAALSGSIGSAYIHARLSVPQFCSSFPCVSRSSVVLRESTLPFTVSKTNTPKRTDISIKSSAILFFHRRSRSSRGSISERLRAGCQAAKSQCGEYNVFCFHVCVFFCLCCLTQERIQRLKNVWNKMFYLIR